MNKKEALAQLRKPVDLKSLTRARARVEIAKDVIAALKVGKIEAGWVYGNIYFTESVTGESLRESMPKMKTCDVCAIGAAFIACVARENEFNVSPRYADGAEMFLERKSIVDRLDPYFSKLELDDMEAAFEVDDMIDGAKLSKDQEFGLRYRDRTKRLIAIMQSIVDNSGTFNSSTKG